MRRRTRQWPGGGAGAVVGRIAVDERKPMSFGLALCGGIILGAFFDNMALGIIIGLILGFGIVKLPRKPD